MNTENICGTFSPSLDGECAWGLFDGTDKMIATATVQDDQRTSIQIAIPAGASGPFKLRIGPCQVAKVIDQSGGIVIVDTVMIHERMPLQQTKPANIKQEKKRA